MPEEGSDIGGRGGFETRPYTIGWLLCRLAPMGLGVRRGRNASTMEPEGAAMWLFPGAFRFEFRSEFRLGSVSCSEGTGPCPVR
jgi:hypothetical protein